MHVTFKVRLSLLSTAHGGRASPIRSDYRPMWNLGNTWAGRPTLNDARVFLVDLTELAPGDSGVARIVPIAPRFWAGVGPGQVIPMLEGQHVVGEATVLQGPEPPIAIRQSQRPLSAEEARRSRTGLSLFDRRGRSMAAAERQDAVVEVLEFQVLRAWLLITCSGPPCCPNHWFLDVGDDEFLELQSWEHLRAIGGAFPGREVKLSVWPRTERILDASCSGAPVESRSLPPEAETGLNGPPGRTELRWRKRDEVSEVLRHHLDSH